MCRAVWWWIQHNDGNRFWVSTTSKGMAERCKFSGKEIDSSRINKGSLVDRLVQKYKGEIEQLVKFI